MSLTDSFSCPHCKKFSFFRGAEFSLPSPVDWRAAVSGFVPYGNGEGIARSECTYCGKPFIFRLSAQVIPIYQEQCPRWPVVTT